MERGTNAAGVGFRIGRDAPCFQGGDLFGAGLVAEGITPQVQPLQVGQGQQRAHINVPQMPSLSDADKADAELYLADMLLCLPIVGVNFFEKPRGPAGKNRELFLSAKDIQARGYEGPGGFVVRFDSQAVKNEVASIPTYLSDLRKALLNQGIFEDTGTAYRLAQDYIFTSPSTAAGVLLGRAINGRTAWRDAERRSLKEIQGAEMETP